MAASDEDLELLFKAERTTFRSKYDVLLLTIHSFLLEDGARCTGIGEWKDAEVPGKSSKALPTDWNSNQSKFQLKYVKNNQKFLLSFTPDRDTVLLAIQDVGSGAMEGTCLLIGDYVNEPYEDFETAYKNLPDLQKKLKTEILDVVTKQTPKEEKKKEAAARPARDDYVDPLMIPGSGLGRPNFGQPERFVDPFNYGRSDLDPFGGRSGVGGGGMLFNIPNRRNPPIPANFPPGAVPPGARFDPIGPLHQMPRPRHPDPDVGLPPPGYDDMFN